METKYDSQNTDGSPWNNRAWVVVRNNKIVEIGEELGREGGVFWRENSREPVQFAMDTIARSWPHLYTKVRLNCTDSLLTLASVQTLQKQQAKSRLRREIKDMESRLNELKSKLINLDRE